MIAALYSSSMAQYCQKSVCGHYIGVWGKLSLVPTVTDQAGCALARAWGWGRGGESSELSLSKQGRCILDAFITGVS